MRRETEKLIKRCLKAVWELFGSCMGITQGQWLLKRLEFECVFLFFSSLFYFILSFFLSPR